MLGVKYMGKSVFDLYPKESFDHILSTDLWKEYVDFFGEEINELFGDRYQVKIRFGHFYREVIDGRLMAGLDSLRTYKENFISEYDLNLYDKFEKICLNAENMKKISKGNWIKDDFNNYCLVIDGNVDEALIKRGFDSHFRFINTLSDYNNFHFEKTSLYCFRNLDEKEIKTINEYFNNNKEAYNELTRFTNKYFEICFILRENGFVESIYNIGCFNKQLTESTAFVVNIKDYGKHIGITYGLTTTSSAEEYKSYFEKFGKEDYNITLRQCLKIVNEEDEETARTEIYDFYMKHKDLTKDALLLVSKEKRKDFINMFTVLLKPFGFKKKSNRWSKDLSDDLVFNFYLNKSQYSDVYYISTWINKKEQDNCICYSKRYFYQGNQQINWQLINLNDFNKWLEEIKKEIGLIINTSLNELIFEQRIICDFACDKNRCGFCCMKESKD